MSHTGKTKQPSGVVLPLMAALESVVHDERVPNEVSQEVAAVLIEARRLNSSPVSAGDVLTSSECACGDQYPANSYGAGFMAANNGVCENCDASAPSHGELSVLREYRTAIRNFNDSHGVETDTLDEAVEIERKAEARLEAAEKACHDFYAGCKQEPSHGDQVREGWKLVPVEPTPEMISAASGAITKPDDLPPVGDGGWSMSDLAFRSRYRAAIAAAPSLASQKEQG